MAEPNTVEQFKQKSRAILDWRERKDGLVARRGWGDQNFEDLRPVLELIFKMTDDLASLPVELIEEGILNALNANLDSATSIFQQIDGFSTSDMVNNRNVIADQVRSLEESIRGYYRTEVPWLAIYSGTSEKWISAAQDEQKRTKEVREEAERQLEAAKDAAKVARESAGEAGAAEFTGAFRDQAKAADTASSVWLRATGLIFASALTATVVFIVLHACGIPRNPTTTEAIIYLGWRVGVVGLLVGGAAWCGRHFRANRHNHEVNQHRAACMENMQAFQRAAEDQGVKDMVVLEFSKAAAQGMPTGFISGQADGRVGASPHLLSLATKQASALTPQPKQ